MLLQTIFAKGKRFDEPLQKHFGKSRKGVYNMFARTCARVEI